eukprot:scaffold1722_cov19-Tisochrysis_lutea.AAC.1
MIAAFRMEPMTPHEVDVAGQCTPASAPNIHTSYRGALPCGNPDLDAHSCCDPAAAMHIGPHLPHYSQNASYTGRNLRLDCYGFTGKHKETRQGKGKKMVRGREQQFAHQLHLTTLMHLMDTRIWSRIAKCPGVDST